MGISSDSFQHDQLLERNCHMFLRWHIEGTTLAPSDQAQTMREALQSVEDASRGLGREAVKFRSPHRRLSIVWELLVREWLEDTGDRLRAASLAHCCARIVNSTLALPQATIDRISAEARAEMTDVIARFEAEAGRSGAVLNVLANTQQKGV